MALAQAGYSVTAVEISDRIRHSGGLADGLAPGSLAVHQDDFYAIALAGRFDVVCYWNGFGVGSDADQRRLLLRVADEWLRPGGVALVDVFNPFVWASWDGDDEHLTPDPAAGYDHDLREVTRFDPVTCTATDTWWESSDPGRPITQTLRCYTPADLALLLTGTGLTLTALVVGDQVLSPVEPRPRFSDLLRDNHEYLAVLRLTG